MVNGLLLTWLNSKLLICTFHIDLVKGENRINLSDYISNLPEKQIKIFYCLPFGTNAKCSFGTSIVAQKEVVIYSDVAIAFKASYLAAIIGY